MMQRRVLCLLAGLVMAVPACSSDDGPAGVAIPLTWQTVVEPYDPGAVVSGWAGAPDDVWVVGGERNQSVVLHYDGTGWEPMDIGVDEPLWWAHGFAGGPLYVAGDHGTMVRFDGQTWDVMETGAPGTVFYGVWGAAPDDMWAVGGPTPVPQGDIVPEGDVVLHYDGNAELRWERVEIQALLDKPASQGKNLFKVWGASADAVFIVGDSGLALHYDGNTWTKVDTGVPGQPLFTVTGRSADDVYAIGGLGFATLAHWDGSAWSEVDLPAAVPEVIQGIWTAPGEALYIAGWNGFTASLDIDGTWDVQETPSDLAYHAIFGDGDGALWAVGGDIYSLLIDHQGIIITTRAEVPAL